MPRKTKIIFIIVFILVGSIMISAYFYMNRSKTTNQDGTVNSDYKPFLGGSTTGEKDISNGTTIKKITDTITSSPIEFPENAPITNKFHQITNFSVAGATFFEDTRPLPISEVTTALPGGEKLAEPTSPTKPTKGKIVAPKQAPPKFEIVPSIRYVERVTGHINQMYLDTKTVGKISNSTIPSIYEVLFDKSASGVLYRYLGTDGKTITSFLANLGSDKGEFLPTNILDVSLSPDKSKFFYLTKTFSGVVGTTRSFKDTKKVQVFTSSLTEWLSQWVTDQKIYLTTKASSSVEGGLFSLNTTSGVLTKVFGGVKGLTTLANTDGSLVLYGSTSFGGSKLGIFDVKNHETKELSLRGLPEKCVWGINNIAYCAVPRDIGNGGLPDSWYQGLISFDDSFVKINTLTGEVSNIADSTSQTPLDATHLFLDKTESQLFFINKKDSTLWSLDLL